MSSFPEGWFFIKSQSSGYYLTPEKDALGEPIVVSTLHKSDYESQLWRHDESGRLINKKMAFVCDVTKGIIHKNII
jgi:hypothetical protein